MEKIFCKAVYELVILCMYGDVRRYVWGGLRYFIICRDQISTDIEDLNIGTLQC